MSWLDLALEMAGLSEDEVAALDAALPAAGRAIGQLKQAEPILTKMKPHVDALMPLVQQLWPHVQLAWPDIVTATPALDDLIEFAISKSK